MPVSFIPFVFPGVDNVRCAFQTRWQEAGDGPYAGGNISLATADDRQSVIGNRRELRAALGLRRMAELNQVHGDAMIFEPDAVEPDAVPRCDADGMATAQAGLGLVIKTADCQPILLAHKSGRWARPGRSSSTLKASGATSSAPGSTPKAAPWTCGA